MRFATKDGPQTYVNIEKSPLVVSSIGMVNLSRFRAMEVRRCPTQRCTILGKFVLVQTIMNVAKLLLLAENNDKLYIIYTKIVIFLFCENYLPKTGRTLASK